jgi:hypothetical protein
MTDAIMSQVKSPDELAQRLSMIDARQQASVLQEIQRRNPQLFIKVMQLMNAERAKGMESGGGRGNVPDSKPLPEQKPPQREESPV